MPESVDLDLVRKLRTVNISRRGLLAAAAIAAAARAGREAAAQDSPQVIYQGETFDAGGATLRCASWPGFWEEMERKHVIDQFEKDFNCKVEYDGAFPWISKYLAGGVDSPPFDVTNWNLPELFRTAKAGDADGGFFVPVEELTANVPNSKDLWPFATANGRGITYLFSQYGYAYRTDLVDPPPTDFKSFWEERFADKRGTYITVNTLNMVFFMVASAVYGKDEMDIDAGVQAMKDAMPMKISEFTGNMQALLEQGEVTICVQHDGEPYLQIDKGVPAGWLYWSERKPVLTQNKTVSKGSDEMQKRLAYAYVNRVCSKEFQEALAKEVYLRPTNKNAVIPENLASKGVVNTEDTFAQLWIPPWDWFNDNFDEYTDRVNEVFGQ